MTNKLLRVSQLDAIQLDNEIIKIIKSSFENSIQYLAPGFTVPLEPEINLIIRLLTLKRSIWRNSATFGQTLLLIKYDNLSQTKKILYILLSSLDYLKSRCEVSLTSHTINNYINLAEILIKISAFINLSIFLRTGVKPILIDRVLGLNQVYVTNNIPRQFDNKYLTRELLWNGLIEFFVFILPLINYHKISRIVRNIFHFQSNPKMLKTKFKIYNLRSKCPHCLDTPIQPHHMGCAHVFCYICLKSNQLADQKYECPICGYNDLICERVTI